MKNLLFFASIFCFTVFVNNTLLAQYSNATLNGPWFLHSVPLQIYDDEATNYVVFDGNGNIIDGSMFINSYSGSTYSVSPSGAISGTLVGTYPLTGQLYSQNFAIMTSGGLLSRISNPGVLTDSLVGILYTENCGQKAVTLRLNSQGQIISASGLISPVTGRVYADSGHFEGHIKTGEAGAWDAFTIIGAYVNDSLTGIVGVDQNTPPCGVETAHLKRFGRVTGIAPIATSTSELIIYPNPAIDIVTLNINNANNGDMELSIYTIMGILVRSEMLKQNQRQINIGDLSNGVYMITIKSKGLTENQRLIIQR